MKTYSGGHTRGPYLLPGEHTGPAGQNLSGHLLVSNKASKGGAATLLPALSPSPQRSYLRPPEAGHTWWLWLFSEGEREGRGGGEKS